MAQMTTFIRWAGGKELARAICSRIDKDLEYNNTGLYGWGVSFLFY